MSNSPSVAVVHAASSTAGESELPKTDGCLGAIMEGALLLGPLDYFNKNQQLSL